MGGGVVKTQLGIKELLVKVVKNFSDTVAKERAFLREKLKEEEQKR